MYHQRTLIGIKERIQLRNIEEENRKQVLEVVTEKATFLSLIVI